jgi:3-mercaptopyruvate sulfurtransferase SseA
MKFTMGIMLLFAISSSAMAMERFDIVTTQQLEQLLIERTQGKTDFCLVNALDTLIYEHHAIPGSVNVPWSRVRDLAEERLGSDHDRLIITY